MHSIVPLGRSVDSMVFVAFAAFLTGLVSAIDLPEAKWGTCGSTGGGRQTCVNHHGYTCYNCGFEPCVDVQNRCWSCTGRTRCWQYDCGTYCSASPCPNTGTCGQRGFGHRTSVNHPGYSCYNCGPFPCAGANGNCYSCYAPSVQRCYKYHCGSYCSTGPCGAEGAETAIAGNASFYDSPAMLSWEPKIGANTTLDAEAAEDSRAAVPSEVAATADADVDLSKGSAPKKASEVITV